MSKSKVEISLSPTGPGDDHPIACGLRFKRAAVAWAASPKIIAVQRKGNLLVDMTGQTGIYQLLSGKNIIYKSGTANRDLGTCLSEHTRDEFSSEWDHFNFFGFREVRSDGTLGKELNMVTWHRFFCFTLVVNTAGHGCSKRAISGAKMIKFKQGYVMA
jgi:hypothetical protein